jgi:hypothetical protein
MSAKQYYHRCAVIILSIAVICRADFQVNTYTNDDQQFPDVAIDESDNFVVVWSSEGQDGGSRGIYGQLFNSNGMPVGSEFHINTSSVAGRTYDGPSVGMDSLGNFVVAWPGSYNSEESIIARRFTSSGTPLGGEFRVNTDTHATYSNSHRLASVAMNEGGAFVIVWSAWHGDDHHNGSFYVTGRSYSAAGVPLGDEFIISQFTDGQSPDVAIDDSGDFVVAWYCHPNQEPYGDNIRFRRYNANCTAKDNAVQITDSYIQVSGLYVGPSIAMDGDGNFVITWADVPNVAYAYDIWSRRFNADGVFLGDPCMVNTYDSGYQWRPSVASAESGAFVVAWWGSGEEDTLGIFSRQYGSDGNAVGDQFLVNNYLPSPQKWPAIAMRSDGQFVAVWQSDGQDGDNYGIFGEFGPKICCADFSGDLFVNFRDFAFLAEEWRQEGNLLQTDMIDDDIIDELDLNAFCQQWLTPCD